MRLIIATSNKGKLKEIRKILAGIKLPLITLGDLDKKFTIKEDGQTFLENALKKALPVSAAYPHDLVVAEDSGLVVKALGNEPGVHSRRFSGLNATDAANNQKLLKALAGVKQRVAAYQCWLVLVKDTRILDICYGSLKGNIALALSGSNGFGYDPLFYLKTCKKTVAQLSLKEKNKISHRAKAFGKLGKYLKRKGLK